MERIALLRYLLEYLNSLFFFCAEFECIAASFHALYNTAESLGLFPFDYFDYSSFLMFPVFSVWYKEDGGKVSDK